MAHVDYLRLCTWDLIQYTKAASALMQYRQGWKPGRFLQYQGHKLESMFFGTAKQGEKHHYLVQISGGVAQTVASDLSLMMILGHEKFYCTRLDVQKTLVLPEWWSVRDVVDSIKDMDVGQTPRTISFIESSSGDTIYIGSRTSDKFIRVYTKSLDKDYLRLEYELKGDLARSAFYTVFQNGGRSVSGIFNSLLVHEKVPQYVKSYYLDPDADIVDIRKTEHAHDMQKKLDWLLSLEATIRKMLADHDIGHETNVFIQSLARYGGHIDGDTPYMLD
jgi:hypothetical protein